MFYIKDEYDYLIHLLKCVITGEQPKELPENLSFKKVFRCAREHSVANMAFYSVEKLADKPDSEMYAYWEGERDLAIARHFNQMDARDEIVRELAKAKIRVLEAQGTLIKPLYPSPDQRTMADLDFIVDPENLSKTEQILLSLGYTVDKSTEQEVDVQRQPNMYVEIHTDYFTKEFKYSDSLEYPFDAAEEISPYSFRPTDEMFYAYSVLHLAKHYFIGGLGIRRVMDLFILNREYKAVRESKTVTDIFKNLDLLLFVEKISALAQAWFSDGELTDEMNVMITQIKRGQTFGSYATHTTNQLVEVKEKSKYFVKTRYFLSQVFNSKEYLSGTYPILKKRPYLLPFVWVIRGFKFLTVDRKKLKNRMSAIIQSDCDNGV